MIRFLTTSYFFSHLMSCASHFNNEHQSNLTETLIYTRIGIITIRLVNMGSNTKDAGASIRMSKYLKKSFRVCNLMCPLKAYKWSCWTAWYYNLKKIYCQEGHHWGKIIGNHNTKLANTVGRQMYVLPQAKWGGACVSHSKSLYRSCLEHKEKVHKLFVWLPYILRGRHTPGKMTHFNPSGLGKLPPCLHVGCPRYSHAGFVARWSPPLGDTYPLVSRMYNKNWKLENKMGGQVHLPPQTDGCVQISVFLNSNVGCLETKKRFTGSWLGILIYSGKGILLVGWQLPKWSR